MMGASIHASIVWLKVETGLPRETPVLVLPEDPATGQAYVGVKHYRGMSGVAEVQHGDVIGALRGLRRQLDDAVDAYHNGLWG